MPSPVKGRRSLGVALAIALAVIIIVAIAAAARHPDNQAASPSPTAASAQPTVSPTPLPTQAPTLATTACSGDPMAHVYRPTRLQILAPCVTVSGTIEAIRTEADGDYHVLIALDSGQKCNGLSCLNDGNRELQLGDLVVEAVCEHPATQSDAIATCNAYHNDLVVPPIGTHVSVTGPWVYDVHGWNEVHPVEQFGT